MADAEHAPSKPPSSLAEACYSSLTTSPLDHAKLEQLPQHMLVQLLMQAVAERDQANATCQQQAEELAKIAKEKELRYIIDLPYLMSRVNMYEHVEAVTAKWTPRLKRSEFTAHDSIDNMPSGCRPHYDTVSKTVSLKRGWCAADTYYPLYQAMSSALLLYRVCCLFAGLYVEVEGPDGYKVVWSAEVQHVATGEAVGFTEWKGAALVRLSNLQGPEQFHEDMLELLNLIYDERCPHPYDGTVAGTIA